MHCLYFICERKFYARTHVKLRDTGNQPLVDIRQKKKLKGLKWKQIMNLAWFGYAR